MSKVQTPECYGQYSPFQLAAERDCETCFTRGYCMEASPPQPWGISEVAKEEFKELRNSRVRWLMELGSRMQGDLAKDDVNHPTHYTTHPSGVECIEVTEHMNFCIGNAVKYLWRAGLKDGNPSVKDLRKAIWYIEREIKRTGESRVNQEETQGHRTEPEAS